jgi:predicted permease
VPIATLAASIAKILALVGIGMALRLTGLLRREDVRVVNALIVYVALPALIFNAIWPAPLTWELARVAGIAWGATLAGLGAAWLVARMLRLPPATAGSFILVSALGNTAYIGYALVTTVLGDGALPRAVFYDIFGTVAALLTAGVIVASHYGEHSEGRVDPVREFLTFPAVIALLLALALKPVPIPAAVMAWLDVPAKMTVPLVMISVGLTLEWSAAKEKTGALAAVAGLKLLLLPAVAAGIALAIRDTGSLRLVTLQAGMPSMMLTLVIGERFRLDTRFMAAAILVTTVACAVTVPVVQALIR